MATDEQASDNGNGNTVRRLNAAVFFTTLIIAIWAAVCVGVYFKGDANQLAIVVQANIGMVLLALGYWFGSSKASADKDEVAKELLTKGGNQ